MASTPIKPTANQYEQASHWVSLRHNATLTPEKYREFQAWLSSKPAHQQAFEEVESYWQQLGGLKTFAQPQLEAARSYASQAQNRRRRLSLQTLAIAASVLLMTISIPLVQLSLDNGIYRTAKGEQKHIQLSDGSRIDLNTDSEVRVSYTLFNRKVKLEYGEAFFSVQHDADKPFEVTAADGLIRDIGTQLNVYRQSDQVLVTVLEGEVSVGKLNATTLQSLRAGMQYTYGQNRQNQLVKSGDFNDVASWREGRIAFKGQRLDVVLEQLSRYHSVKLSISNSKLAALKVSGSFPTNDLNLALNTITASLPIKINQLGTDRIALIASDKVK